ncbi:hypothetical protein JJV70_15145 [Streptomyces sp. JJ66]|uniref:hypothetical protein n=1 Tax=Streptomyces sp. JJ66 TaxID=2803843 RepID=UPI001C5A2990|nr:hypothetical protein [Streptomyces sp. JJ66]MBW1603415.1 hypothetical protein [Streptomyces sp. JJ66]
MTDTTPTADTDWPEGVIARYVTVGGATVDLTHDTLTANDTAPNVTSAQCGGCPAYRNYEWRPRADRFDNGSTWADSDARPWAQEHAERCRAMPRPA